LTVPLTPVRRVAASAVLAVWSCTGTVDKGAATRDTRSAIQAAIDRSVDATRRQDIHAFMSGFAPQFELSTGGGERASLAQLRANALRDWAIIPATRDIWTRINSMGPVAQDSAIVYTSQRWDRLMLERDGVTSDTVVTTQEHRELWKHTAGGWKSARVTELGGTILVNGTPFTP